LVIQPIDIEFIIRQGVNIIISEIERQR